MADYWLDSNVFIEGKKGPYGFDIAPSFWRLIDELIGDGRIACPSKVYQELLDGQDKIANWAKERKNSGVFVCPTEAVQEKYKTVVSYVMRHYPGNQARRRFLARADPWIIAHAIAQGGAVVTLESPNPANSLKVKIPNVCKDLPKACKDLTIGCINTYDMLRRLRVSWNC